MSASRITEEQLAAAIKAGQEARSHTPHALSVMYDRATRTFIVHLLAGAVVQFKADQVREIAGATDEQLADVTMSPSGSALSWPQLDMDIAVPGLMFDLVAGENWKVAMRAMLMREVQAAQSPAKAAAARENGRKGGRPRQSVAERAGATTKTLKA